MASWPPYKLNDMQASLFITVIGTAILTHLFICNTVLNIFLTDS